MNFLVQRSIWSFEIRVCELLKQSPNHNGNTEPLWSVYDYWRTNSNGYRQLANWALFKNSWQLFPGKFRFRSNLYLKKKSTCFNVWKHGPTVSDKPGKILRFITFSSYGLFNLSNASPTQNFFKILKQRRDAIKQFVKIYDIIL